MGFTQDVENRILNAVFSGTPFSQSSLYVALFTSTPSATDSGTEVPYANGYARQGVSANSHFSVVSGGYIENDAPISFPSATGSWGTIKGVGIFDAGSGGARIFQGPLSANAVVNSGDQFSFAAGDLSVTMISSC